MAAPMRQAKPEPSMTMRMRPRAASPAAAQDIQQMFAHPGQGQFQIVVAQVHHQDAVGRSGEALQRRKYGREGRVGDHPVQLRHRTCRIEVGGRRLGQEVHEVAIDDQGDSPARRLPGQIVHEARQFRSGAEDLEAVGAAEMQVGNDVRLVKLQQRRQGPASGRAVAARVSNCGSDGMFMFAVSDRLAWGTPGWTLLRV